MDRDIPLAEEAEESPQINLKEAIYEKELDRLLHIKQFNTAGMEKVAESIRSAGRFVPLCGSFKYEATRLLQLISKTVPLLGAHAARGETWSSINLTYPETIQQSNNHNPLASRVEAVVIEKKERMPERQVTLLIYVPSEMQFRSYAFALKDRRGMPIDEPAIGSIIMVFPLNPDSLVDSDLNILNEKVRTKNLHGLDKINQDRVQRTLCLLKKEGECIGSAGCEWVADTDFAMAMRYWPLRKAEVAAVIEQDANLMTKGNYKDPTTQDMLKLGVRFFKDGIGAMGSQVPSGACTLKKDVTKMQVNTGGWLGGRGHVEIPQFVISPGISMSPKNWEGGAATLFKAINHEDGKTVPNRDGGLISLLFKGIPGPESRETLREFVWMYEPYLSADGGYSTNFLKNLMNSSMFEDGLEKSKWGEIQMLNVIWNHTINPSNAVYREFVAQTLFNLFLDGDPYLPPNMRTRDEYAKFLFHIVASRERQFVEAHRGASRNDPRSIHIINNYWGNADHFGNTSAVHLGMIDTILQTPTNLLKLKMAWCKRCLRIFRNGESKFTRDTTTRNSARVVVNKMALEMSLKNLISSTPHTFALRRSILSSNLTQAGEFDWYQTPLTFTGFGLGGAFAQITAMISDLIGFPFLGVHTMMRRTLLGGEGMSQFKILLEPMPLVTQMFSFGANRVGNMGFAQYFGLRNLHGETFNVFRENKHSRSMKSVKGDYPITKKTPVLAVDPRNGAIFTGTFEEYHADKCGVLFAGGFYADVPKTQIWIGGDETVPRFRNANVVSGCTLLAPIVTNLKDLLRSRGAEKTVYSTDASKIVKFVFGIGGDGKYTLDKRNGHSLGDTDVENELCILLKDLANQTDSSNVFKFDFNPDKMLRSKSCLDKSLSTTYDQNQLVSLIDKLERKSKISSEDIRFIKTIVGYVYGVITPDPLTTFPSFKFQGYCTIEPTVLLNNGKVMDTSVVSNLYDFSPFKTEEDSFDFVAPVLMDGKTAVSILCNRILHIRKQNAGLQHVSDKIHNIRYYVEQMYQPTLSTEASSRCYENSILPVLFMSNQGTSFFSRNRPVVQFPPSASSLDLALGKLDFAEGDSEERDRFDRRIGKLFRRTTRMAGRMMCNAIIPWMGGFFHPSLPAGTNLVVSKNLLPDPSGVVSELAHIISRFPTGGYVLTLSNIESHFKTHGVALNCANPDEGLRELSWHTLNHTELSNLVREGVKDLLDKLKEYQERDNPTMMNIMTARLNILIAGIRGQKGEGEGEEMFSCSKIHYNSSLFTPAELKQFERDLNCPDGKDGGDGGDGDDEDGDKRKRRPGVPRRDDAGDGELRGSGPDYGIQFAPPEVIAERPMVRARPRRAAADGSDSDEEGMHMSRFRHRRRSSKKSARSRSRSIGARKQKHKKHTKKHNRRHQRK